MQSAREALFLLFSIPFYMILIGAEIIFSNLQQKKYYSVRDTVQNIYFTLLNAGLDGLLRVLFYISVLAWSYQHHFIQIENPYWYWIILFIGVDLAFYVEHRVDHYCRFFWAVHVTHHSSGEFNLTTGFRSSVFQPVYRFIYLAPIALLGFTPLDIIFMYSATQTYGILVHTQYIKKMPRWFEAVFVSPSHHRVHHASNIIYLDKNLGMCLIIWDKLFGSFQEELEEVPVKYGLTKPVEDPSNPVNIIFHEWKSMAKDVSKTSTFTTKLKYIFMPPGWSHDGSSKTAVQLRKAQKNPNN
ncbi:MAG: sterol desaturase family protein [Chitinophagaceae bacterium]|nr:sterol desaturase family protein [Chitinophagaceae bacterium]MBK7557935.1 sterol desaturase family protein [Chitinophagaceae bacterium]MBK9531629.1 sterol desaturase family protein [Chitinophagaceae bacterium]HQW92372.1 sterol desaturase family protein [Ferruginibacter sp.]